MKMKTTVLIGLVVCGLILALMPGRRNDGAGGEAAHGAALAKAKPIPPSTHARPAASHGSVERPADQGIDATVGGQSGVQTDGAARSERRALPSDAAREVVAAEKSIDDAALPDALAALAKDPSTAAAEVSKTLLGRWAQKDAAAAAAWIAQAPEGSVSGESIQQVAVGWANTDLASAVAWCGSLPEGANKQAATLSLAYEATRTDPRTALTAVSTLPATAERNDLLVHAVSQWAGSDAATAGAWAAIVPDAGLRQHLLAAVAVALAEQDGTAAATLAATGLGAGEEQDRTVVAVVQRWAQISPQEAASWVAQFPDTPTRTAAAENLVTLWTAADSEAAGHWLRELPQGSLRDIGLTAYAHALAAAGRGFRVPLNGSAHPL